MKLVIQAEGGPATGKTFILDKIRRLLELYGFETFKQGETQGGEILMLEREDDKVNFIVGDKMLQLGDWAIELDTNNILVSAYHEGKDIYAREIEVNFAVGNLTTITTMNVIKRDTDSVRMEDAEYG